MSRFIPQWMSERKFVALGQRDQHAGRVRYPEGKLSLNPNPARINNVSRRITLQAFRFTDEAKSIITSPFLTEMGGAAQSVMLAASSDDAFCLIATPATHRFMPFAWPATLSGSRTMPRDSALKRRASSLTLFGSKRRLRACPAKLGTSF